MSLGSFLKKNRYLIFFGLLISVYLFNDCSAFVFIEYLKLKFTSIDDLRSIYIGTQFVNDSTQNQLCLLTVSEFIYNQNGVPELFKVFLPRGARVVLQQILILTIIFAVLLKDFDYKHTLKMIDFKFFNYTFLGLILSYSVVSIYVDFETVFYSTVFIVFSIFKSFIAFAYINQNKLNLKILILCIFPIFSTGFGISWMFDFLIYFLVFNFSNKENKYIKNKNLLILLFVLICSLLSPFLNTPSLETQIINDPDEYHNIINNIDIANSKNTFLETKDINYLNQNIDEAKNQDLDKEIINLSRNLKDTNYPNRWGIMVSFLPDLKYHIPSFVWYLNLSFLFFLLLNQIKFIKFDNLKNEINSSANILFFYPLISIFTGINYFFNSISEFLFFLTRKAEMINFGEIQTWRGINTHYEIFSNLQLFCFCFFIMNFYLNRSFKSFAFILISSTTALLSQSRFTTLVLFILLFVLFITFFKEFKKEIIVLVLSIVIIFQFIPIFEREEPFFAEEEDLSIIFTPDMSLYGFEFISDRLNRTLPWVVFASGYNPSFIELIFGHGTGAYLNIVKFTEIEDFASGPHSILLSVLNRFGLLGLLVFLIYIIKYFIYIFNFKNKKQFIFLFLIFSLLFSLEIKTDSIMLADGVAIFLFNLLLGIIYKKLYSNNSIKNKH